MNTHRLPNLKVTVLRENLAEVIINQGVEIDEADVCHFFTFLAEHLSPPYGLLVNKIHSYAYSFAAQRVLRDHPEVGAIAIVAHSSLGQRSAEFVSSFLSDNTKSAVFMSYTEALAWLKEQLLPLS